MVRKPRLGENAVRPAVDLLRDRVSVGYRLRLNDALRFFEEWLAGRNVLLVNLIPDIPRLNSELAAYAQHCYDLGIAEWRARHAILGVQDRCRELKGRLRLAWDGLFAWRRIEGTRSRLPMRLEVVQAVCHYAVMAALELEPGAYLEWMAFSVVIRIGFHGLLRPQEIFGLTANAVKLPGPGVFRGLTFGPEFVAARKKPAAERLRNIEESRSPPRNKRAKTGPAVALLATTPTVARATSMVSVIPTAEVCTLPLTAGPTWSWSLVLMIFLMLMVLCALCCCVYRCYCNRRRPTRTTSTQTEPETFYMSKFGDCYHQRLCRHSSSSTAARYRQCEKCMPTTNRG